MSITLPIEVYEVFEKGFGKEDAKKVLKSLEEAIGENVVNKWYKTKDELREEFVKEVKEITKDFATKQDLENVRIELLGKIEALYEKTEKDKVELLGKIEKDKTELLGKMEKDKAEILGKTEKDKVELLGIIEATKAELLGKIDALYEKTEKDKVELLGIIEATKAEVKAEITKMKLDFLRLDKKVTIMFTAVIFLIVFLNQNALEFIAKVLGLIR